MVCVLHADLFLWGLCWCVWCVWVSSSPDEEYGVQILESLEVGDTVDVKGPIGHFHYDRPGHYKNHKLESEVKRINMIAGGTGLTPMYQVMKAILSNPADLTELRLLYANQTEADILLRPELEALAKSHPDRCAALPTCRLPPPLCAWPPCVCGACLLNRTASRGPPQRLACCGCCACCGCSAVWLGEAWCGTCGWFVRQWLGCVRRELMCGCVGAG